MRPPAISLNWHQACTLLVLAELTEDLDPDEAKAVKQLREKLAGTAGIMRRSAEQADTEDLHLPAEGRAQRQELLTQVPASVWDEVQRRGEKR